METLMAIKEAANVDRVHLEVSTGGIPRVLLCDAGGDVVSSQSPPEQTSDLESWLDGILDGISI